MTAGCGVPVQVLFPGGCASVETGKPRTRPRGEPTVQHLNGRVSEVLEKPECARGAHARLIVVDDDRRRGIDAAQVEEMIDHPHERAERRRIGIDQRHAPQIEVDGARNVTVREILRRTQVQDQRRPVTLQRLGKIAG